MGELVRRRLGTVVVLAALLVLFSANRLAVLVTDFWWFDARGYREVFTTVLSARIILGVVFGLALTALIAVNLLIARKFRPFFVPSSPQQAQIQRYREMADPYLPWLIAAVALVFGVTSGLAVSANWEPFLLWQNAIEVGTTDPTFDTDVGYYLFTHPFLSFLQTWLFTSLILTALLTVGAHYLLGAIRPEADEKVMPAAKAQLSLLLIGLLAVRGWGYWLDRYDLNYSDRGTVVGAAYTDVNAELPALYLLLGVTVIAIGLVAASIRSRGFLLPGAAVGILVVASVLLQGAYPAAIQRLQVDPQELPREREFIANNLEATRAAYGLDGIDLPTFTIGDDLDEDDVIENAVTLTNVRLWDPDVLETTYQELQSLRPFYEFNNVSIDRYDIDGELRQVMLSTRDLSELQEGADNWQNRHITYTHGFGVVASQVNTADAEGQPVFISANIPPAGSDEVVPDEEPGVYFGEWAEPVYSLVNTDADELDFEDPETGEQVFTGGYDGEGGVGIDSFSRRIAFALRFADYNLVLTGLLNDESRVIFNREVRQRVSEVAPFLTLDDSPYPVVTEDGRIVYIVDGYTTSDAYPYSEFRQLQTGNQVQRVNYVRNSVKAVVDAHDGTIDLYRVEDDDPVLDAWSQAFPDLLQDADEAPEQIERHFRYPQDMFRLQASLYATYHIPDADGFFNRADAWSIPADPVATANVQGGAEFGQQQQQQTGQQALEPYYLLMRLPGEAEEEFVLIQPYLAQGRPNMIAWLAGRSDPGNLNELFAVRFPSDQQVLGPAQAQARIEQDDEISEYITLRDREGIDVIRGNLQVLPIADSILYVEPLFLQADNALIPELRRVALVLGGRTAFDVTFAGALAQLLGIDVPDELLDAEGVGQVTVDDPTADDDELEDAPPADDDAPEDDDELTISQQMLRDALAAFARAEEALRDGDLATYQSELAEARQMLEEAAEAEGVDGLEGLAEQAAEGEAAEDADDE